MTDQVKEVMKAVDAINDELEAHYLKLGYYEAQYGDPRYEQNPTPHLIFSYAGTACGVSFEDWAIWDTESGPTTEDDDTPIETADQFEKVFREAIRQRVTTYLRLPPSLLPKI